MAAKQVLTIFNEGCAQPLLLCTSASFAIQEEIPMELPQFISNGDMKIDVYLQLNAGITLDYF
ncbi:hypothetical protein [Comamonas odontotermitis]|uniref:hypothetical protein n=1 Tax=Comamonas TaxID=283 RepID=UPI001CC4610A|nr:hypothetical protein [Comamonas odontotermitis]UBB19405.1 hypothetical protein LAD35_20745 [Comamonas odontotermitis]